MTRARPCRPGRIPCISRSTSSGEGDRVIVGPMTAAIECPAPWRGCPGRRRRVVGGRRAPPAGDRGGRLSRSRPAPRAAEAARGHPLDGRRGRRAGDRPQAGQIFDSNRFSLRGLVEAAGAEAVDDGIVPDQFDELHAAPAPRRRARRRRADLRGRLGGRLRSRQGRCSSRRAASTSGRWRCSRDVRSPSGSIGRAHFFGLPGNPVASMLTFHLFVRPALWKLAGRRELFAQPFHATAAEPLSKKTGRREFKRGILSCGGRADGRCAPPDRRAPASSPP